MLNKNFWLYAIGRWISQVGWVIQDIAVPLYVLDKTGSGAIMSIFIIAELLPRLLVNPVAGVIGDRYNRKKLMVWLDIARGVLLFGVILFNLLYIQSLLAIQVIMSIMGAFFSAGISGMFPDLVKREELAQANSTLQSGGQIIRIAGPILGGIIYAFGGLRLAILINAISFFGSGLFEMLIEYQWGSRKISSLGEVWEDMLEGFKFIKNSKSLLILVSLGIVLNTLLNPIFVVILPYMSRVILGFSSVQFGSIQTAATIGALAGNLLIAGKLKESSENLLFKALFAQLICLLLLSVVVHPLVRLVAYPALLGIFMIGGFFNILVNVPLFTKLQKGVPNEVRARFFSAFETAIMATTPLGMAVIGPLLDIVDISALVATLVTLSLLASIYYYLNFRESVMNIGVETRGMIG
ncbi:MFS transporter [Thermococcus argininiproducens]|uniref:MFS transporter n=1 Tax=Thermococcus argininiproducens TaxID=2866384 RepID=A0A9E7M949_9EURY|nr:MFS transporter [Thermococcus argininiproducens]USG99640.1 MFS transporter [Thermococcus argininiproducens]